METLSVPFLENVFTSEGSFVEITHMVGKLKQILVGLTDILLHFFVQLVPSSITMSCIVDVTEWNIFTCEMF